MKAVILLALLAVPAAGVSLRAKADPAKPADIKQKWGKMDGFLKVMFSMACKWKNGKDVALEAKDALKNGDVSGADGYAQYVKDVQAKNVQALEKSCGLIIAESKKNCRDGCAARWNQMAVQRDECDQKCESVYGNFERSCESKAEGLVKVYEQKSAKAAGQRQCYEGHCKEFPQVWMKEDEAAMTAEVETQCKDRCTSDKYLKAVCRKKWALTVDTITASVMSKCAEDSELKTCIDKKQKTVSGDYDKCQADTTKSCDAQYDICTKKGNADKNFKDAKAFCTDRKKMCVDQTNAKCLKENKAGLDKAESECKSDNNKALRKCQDDALGKKEEEQEKKCLDETKGTCDKDCAASCEVGKMNDCLVVLKQQDDPGKLFCQDFYHMLHTAAETDPVTGDPIALFQIQ